MQDASIAAAIDEERVQINAVSLYRGSSIAFSTKFSNNNTVAVILIYVVDNKQSIIIQSRQNSRIQKRSLQI